MKVVLTAGGTAGHINPAIATAEELTKRGHEVIFAGTPNRLESKLVPQEGYEFKAFEAYGFNRRHPKTIVKALSSILKSTKLATAWLQEIKPDCVIGFGCYVSLAICRAAKKLGIPYAVHEQNSVMGMSNKYLSKNAKATCLTYKRADTGKCNNVVITGNPVRSKFLSVTKEEGRKMLGIPMNAKVLLVFGGSLGAKHINEAIVKLVPELLKRKNLYIVHITGRDQYDSVIENSETNDRYIVLPYQDKMGETMAAADMCISRAGASTLAEITAMCLPALLVPYPYATENHQFYNAKSLLDSGCVMYIPDHAVETKEFDDAVFKLVDDEDMRADMVEAFKAQEPEKSVKKLVSTLESIC